MYVAKNLLKYESCLADAKFIPLRNDCFAAGFSYSRHKRIYVIDGREFYEKGFLFYDQGKLYRYLTSIPNSVGEPEYEGDFSKKPQHPDSPVRGETLFSIVTVERDEKGKLKLTMLMQMDFKLRLPSFIISSFMPSTMKTWYTNVNKFVSNKKNFQ